LVLGIQGGTDRFQNASGVLTYAEAVAPVSFETSGRLALGTEVGEITGTISGPTRRITKAAVIGTDVGAAFTAFS